MILFNYKISERGKHVYTRVKQIREKLKLNQAEFAKKIGLSQSTLAMIEVNKRTFSDKHIKLICSEFGVSENWLRTGEGDMFASSPYEKEFLNIFDSLTSDTKEYLLLMAKELLKTQNKLLNSKK